MTAPRITIVTPSYNQVSYLQDNLDSVARQRYENIEHIVLDGGSDDGSVSIIESYADRESYDVVWRSEADAGQSAAINEGFERATGDIVGWLNSDDVYFDPGVFERVVDSFRKLNTDVLYGDLAYVDGASRVTEIDVRPRFDRAKLAYRILIGQPATFFRSEVVNNHKLDTSLQFCMDYEFWIRISKEYDIRHVQDILAGFRRHEKQKTEDMSAVSGETEQMLSIYRESLPSNQRHVIIDNIITEIQRTSASVAETIRIAESPPELAFDGTFAPLPELLRNVGPGVDDMKKALRRWRQ